MEKKTMLYEGKAKQVFKTDREDCYIIRYKDDATAFNGQKKGQIAGKGVINNKMTAIIFEALSNQGIETHFLRLLNDNEQLVKAVEIVPLEVIPRNIAAGSLCKRLGIVEGTILKRPVLELCYKDDELGDPLINDDHALALGLVTEEELTIIHRVAMEINDWLIAFFEQRQMVLVDFKIEFGRHQGRLVLADEISPDTCRLWDKTTGKKLDKDRFRRNLGDVEEAYQEVLKRLE